MTEEDSRKGSGGKRKRVAADDGEDEKRKTRSMAEPDWVGRVMGRIEGMVRTMEENEKRVESFRQGLEARLKVMEGNMVELGRMVKIGVNTIMADQYELRKAIKRDDEGTRRDDEVTEDKNDGSDEGDKETKEDEKDEEKDEEIDCPRSGPGPVWALFADPGPGPQVQVQSFSDLDTSTAVY